ncbi:glycoside hydrolase family 72 protein [Hypoxylon sp. FL0890]|nr:glycoside hydrolase family 72 protein [Hypoxylon sp. FL0890]
MAPSVTPVTVKGRYFWKDDKRFMINGVIYQPHGQGREEFGTIKDPLSDDKIHWLARSIPLLKELQINTLIVYDLDSSKNYDASMSMLAEAGIYVLPCIAPIQNGVGMKSGATFETYYNEVLQSYFRAIDNMARYSNTLGLVVSYEFIKDATLTVMAPLIRSVVRDVKRYMRLVSTKRTQRVLPVGIIASDIQDVLKPQFDYFAAEPDSEALDFFAFNNFSWAGISSMKASGYEGMVKQFSSTPIPVFLSSYGNTAYTPRLFQETLAIYTDKDMLRIFSGGAVYEFFQGFNEYGLVKAVETPGNADIRITKFQDFGTLRERIRRAFVLLPEALSSYSNTDAPSGKRPDPPQISRKWQGAEVDPESPLNWAEIENQIADSEWVDVAKEMVDIAVDDLASSIWDKLNVDEIEP